MANDGCRAALLPCPFCGSDEITAYGKVSMCTQCGANHPIQAWNTRAPAAAQANSVAVSAEYYRQALENIRSGNYGPNVKTTEKCPHDRYGYEDCLQCVDDYITDVLAAAPPAPAASRDDVAVLPNANGDLQDGY